MKRGVRPDLVTDQTSAHDPVNGYLPQGWTVAEWAEKRERDPQAVSKAAKKSMATHVRAMLDFHKAGIPTVDYGNNIRQMAQGGGGRERVRFSRLRAGLYPSALLPRHRAVPLGGALGRPGGHLQDRRQGEGTDAGQHAPAQLARHGAKAHPLPGTAGAHLLGGPGRSPSPRSGLQRDGSQGRVEGAGRHRPRPSGFRLGRFAEPRDRSDEGRLGRRVRLAAAQCTAQHRIRRHLGVAASWRRRRHGLLAAFRHGDLRRRYAGGRRQASAACSGTTRRPA